MLWFVFVTCGGRLEVWATLQSESFKSSVVYVKPRPLSLAPIGKQTSKCTVSVASTHQTGDVTLQRADSRQTRSFPSGYESSFGSTRGRANQSEPSMTATGGLAPRENSSQWWKRQSVTMAIDWGGAAFCSGSLTSSEDEDEMLLKG